MRFNDYLITEKFLIECLSIELDEHQTFNVKYNPPKAQWKAFHKCLMTGKSEIAAEILLDMVGGDLKEAQKYMISVLKMSKYIEDSPDGFTVWNDVVSKTMKATLRNLPKVANKNKGLKSHTDNLRFKRNDYTYTRA